MRGWDWSPKFRRKLTAFLYDIGASAAAFYLALDYSYGLGLSIGHVPGPHASIIYTFVFTAIAGVFLWANGLHRGIWRYTSLLEFITILRVATFTTLCFLPFAFLTVRAELLPRSTPIIAWFLMVALVGGPRILWRALADGRTPRPLVARLRRRTGASEGAESVPILVAGSTRRAEPFIREMRRHADAPYLIVGILSNDAGGHGLVMHGVPVFGGLGDISDALAYLRQRNIRPQRLVIADDNADEAKVAHYLEVATRHGLTLGRVPRLMDIAEDGNGAAAQVRPIALSDLLGRPQAVLDKGAIQRLVTGKRVLVTGAGGSIGSELVRQISDLSPSTVVLLDNSEFNLYSIEKELGERHPNLERHDALCDVRDQACLGRWFAKHRPDIVFHAAALKHVPLVESHPIEGIRTNVLGTQNVADACALHSVAKMVLISTDKAVNPHNTMGATKRSAEAYCQAMDAEGGTTRFVAVRFGNVLGSAGSVVPLFQRQLASGGPLTVTHPEITRYFMTIPEAVALVLQASTLGSDASEDRGGVYILDMGKPIKITDLARQMIRLSGKQPDIDVKIEFVGLRPGEKLFEELVHQAESSEGTAAEGVMVISPRTAALSILRLQFAEIAKACEHFDEDRTLRLLSLVVPEFHYEDAQKPAMPASKAVLTTPPGHLSTDRTKDGLVGRSAHLVSTPSPAAVAVEQKSAQPLRIG
jgi:O-antigen biosynthesis protein WbqV